MTYSDSEVQLRNVPYPYKGMVSISSDTDNSSWLSFIKIHKYFHGLEESIDSNINLEFSDSCWIFSERKGEGDIAFASPSLGAPLYREAPLLADLIQHQVIDTLHTWGHFNKTPFSRDLAFRGRDILEKYNLQIPVWTYHGNNKTNPQNIQRPPVWDADNPLNVNCYHTDILFDIGVKFISKPLQSEVLGEHSPLELCNLKDGQKIWTFKRFAKLENPANQKEIEQYVKANVPGYERFALKKKSSDKTVVIYWTLPMFHYQFDDAILDIIARDSLICVFAQHLTRKDHHYAISKKFIERLQRLTSRQMQGDILVAATSRLLKYVQVRNAIHYRWRLEGKRIVINIERILDLVFGDLSLTESNLQGISFLVISKYPPKLEVQGKIPKTLFTEFTGQLKGSKNRWVIYFPWERREIQQKEAIKNFVTKVGDTPIKDSADS